MKFLFVGLFLLKIMSLSGLFAQTVRDIYLADPAIFYHDGLYYLYGTRAGGPGPTNQGIPVYVSSDLYHWEGHAGVADGLALRDADSFGDRGFWAPQVFENNGLFYMAYTANEHIAMAISDSPLGPFKNSSMLPIEAPVRLIDPFVFFDDDGKIYLYHVRLQEGNRLFVAEMNKDLLSIRPETVVECIAAEEPWEDTQDVRWKVVEGPTVLKHKGLYYMIYSANHFRNPDYAVGYAVAESPTGPWKKSPKNPIIHRSILPEFGTGHGDVFFDAKGNMQYVLHTHFSNTEVRPRKSAVVDISFKEVPGRKYDTVVINKKTFRILKAYDK